MLCNRCLPFLCLQKRQKKKSHISRNEVRNSFLKQKSIRERRLEKNAFTPKIKQSCGSVNDAVGQLAAPPSFNRRYPTSHKGARASEAMIHAPYIECLKCFKKRSSRNYRSFRPLRSCAVGNAEDVRLRFYRQFRLCFTTTDFGGRKGIGLSPYPYQISTRKESLNGQPRH